MKIRWMCNMIAVSLTCCTCFLYSVETTSQTEEIAKTELTASSMAKDKVMLALADFIEFSKETLQEGIEATKYEAAEAGNFAKSQIPFVLQELVILRKAEVIVYCLFLVFIIVFTQIFASMLLKRAKLMPIDEEDPREFFIFCSIFLRNFSPIVILSIFIANFRDWSLPWFAPRIYLIEYAIDMIKNIS